MKLDKSVKICTAKNFIIITVTHSILKSDNLHMYSNYILYMYIMYIQMYQL